MTMPQADVHGPSVFGTAVVRQQGPPPIELPAPTFVTWGDAVTYTRAAMRRIKYLQAQLANAQASVDQAQLQLAAMQEELRLLNIAASTAIIGQGLNLA